MNPAVGTNLRGTFFSNPPSQRADSFTRSHYDGTGLRVIEALLPHRRQDAPHN